MLFIAKTTSMHSYRAHVSYTVVEIAAYIADLRRMCGTINTLARIGKVSIVVIG